MSNSRVLAFISSMLLSAATLAAADLSGRVTFQGAPLPGAVVTANMVGTQDRKASVTITRTDSQGWYALKGLRNGQYILLVDMQGRRVYQGRVVLTSPTLVKNIQLR